MKKNKFLRISKYKKLRYIANNYKKNLYIVFLPGFASDIDGDKPKKFLNFSMQKTYEYQLSEVLSNKISNICSLNEGLEVIKLIEKIKRIS